MGIAYDSAIHSFKISVSSSGTLLTCSIDGANATAVSTTLPPTSSAGLLSWTVTITPTAGTAKYYEWYALYLEETQ
jgi:hypothetical protein